MDKCVLCGQSKLRQPTIPGGPCKCPIVPLSENGVTEPHNYVTLCRYHERMYHKWFNEEEMEIAEKVIRDAMRQSFPKWKKEHCTLLSKEINTGLMSKIRRMVKK